MLTQTTSRERFLLFGQYKIGKSTIWLDIADAYYQSWDGKKEKDLPRFYVIDTDFSAEKMFEEGYQHLIDVGMVTIYTPHKFEQLQKDGKEIFNSAKKGDWIVIDMLTYPWAMAQDFYTRGVYGKEPENYFLQMRKEVVAKGGKDKRAYGGHEGTDWGFITKIYKQWEMDLTMYSPANVFAVCEERKLDVNRGASADQVKRFKAVGGMEPVGQKGIGHRLDTVLRMTQRANGQRQVTLAGERGKQRGQVWVDRGSVVLDIGGAGEKHGRGFTEQYLVEIAGWTMGKEKSRRNDSKRSKKKGKKEKKVEVPVRRRRK